jgi:Ca-activated chloride channel family protein
MGTKPTPVFWLTAIILVVALVAFALYRANTRSIAEPSTIAERETEPSGNRSLTVSFYSSSAKKTWIDEMVKEFNDAKNRVGDQIIEVKPFHGNSGDQLDLLKEGKIKPDIWSPGDESWLQLAAAHWKSVKQKELFGDQHPLVNIPLVIAMWEPMAQALGHPRPIGWRDIEKVASNPKGWAAYGHPEWGKFRWGHAHPDANSGFLSIVSETYAALDKIEGITPADLKAPKVVAFLRGFEGAVEHYGLSNSWLDDVMRAKGPAYLSCAVQYENTIIESNQKSGNKPFKLVAVYPREGSFWTQHPSVILKEDWVTPEKAEAAKKFIDYLLSADVQARAVRMGLRPISPNAALTAPFDEEHGVQVKIENSRRFVVPSEDVLKRIRDLWEEVKTPATIVMALDRSGSMAGRPLDNAKAGAIEFVKKMKPRDQIMVMLFNKDITTLSDLCSIRNCGEQTIARVGDIFAEGGTALHDTVKRAYDFVSDLQRKEPNRRYSILVLSDGRDTASLMDRNDFLDALPKGPEFDVPKIYTIAYGDEADRNLLTEISNRTNARLFVSSPEQIAQTYKELSANF